LPFFLNLHEGKEVPSASQWGGGSPPLLDSKQGGGSGEINYFSVLGGKGASPTAHLSYKERDTHIQSAGRGIVSIYVSFSYKFTSLGEGKGKRTTT